MILIRLPRPLSVNGLYYNHRAGGRSASLSHRNWRLEAMQEISAQRPSWPVKAIVGPYKLQLVVRPILTKEGRHKGDLGNLEKCVSDVLVKMAVIRDDSDAEEILLRWGDAAGCEVTLTSA